MAANSRLGYGMACAYCTVALPDYLGTYSPVTAIQPPLGLTATNAQGKAVASTASGRVLLAQDLIRRFSTPRGSLPDTAIPTVVGNYGIEINDYVYDDMTPDGLGALAAAIDAQAKQDERVVASKTSCSLAGNILLITINVTDGAGPFKLVFSLDTANGDFSVLSSPT